MNYFTVRKHFINIIIIYRSDFNEYVHDASNRIDVADAASALLDVLPYVPESMAKALFATRPFNDGTISFDDWWGDIEKFFTIAKHITHGTRPAAEVYFNKYLFIHDFYF